MTNEILQREFNTVEDMIAEKMAMRRQLQMIAKGNFIKGELLGLVDELLESAKPVPGRADAVAWGFDEPGNMPSDARVDFFYIPTYISTAILIYATMNYPEDIKRFDAFKNILAKALYTSTLREFEGHGYEGVRECRSIFRRVGVDKFLEEHPQICPQFTKLWYQKMLTVRKEW